MPSTLPLGQIQPSIVIALLLISANCIVPSTGTREFQGPFTSLNITDHSVDSKGSDSQRLTMAQLNAWAVLPQFAELAEQTTQKDTVLSSLDLYSAAVVVVPGSTPPDRPLDDSALPFLTVVEGQYWDALSSILPLGPINKAAATTAVVLGKPLYPFRLHVLEFDKTGMHAPWAVYHVPSGTIYLDKQLVNNIQELPLNMGSYVMKFAEQMFHHLSETSISGSNSSQAFDVSSLGQSFSTAAASAAGLALASQVPLWFCIACPIVLGMLFPFAFNFGLGAIADELCTYYNLPADECTQLWYSAFALAMILSFASVIPIVSICKLAQCAKPSSPAPSL